MSIKVPTEYNTFDFGFTGVDDPVKPEAPPTAAPTSPEVHERFDALEQKLEDMVAKLTSSNIASGTESELKDKIRQLEAIIVPLLNNLLKTASKDYIFWPNRKDAVEKQLQHVLEITRGG